MNKKHFLFLFALIASICNLWAEDVTLWEEDFSTGDISKYVTTGSGTKVYAKDNYAGGTAPELLIAKNGGSFQVKVSDLQGLYGKMTLTFKSNKGNLKDGGVTTSTEGVSIVGTPAYADNVWTVVFNVPAEATSLTFTITNSLSADNVRCDDFKLVGTKETQCAAPTFNLTDNADYATEQSLVITSATKGATIAYTIEGINQTGPITGTQASPATIQLTANGLYTVKATATKDGLEDSAESEIMFTIDKKCEAPTFKGVDYGATYGEAKDLYIENPNSDSRMKVTVTSSNEKFEKQEQEYAYPLRIEKLSMNGTYTVTATATKDDYTEATSTITFTIDKKMSKPTFNLEEGVTYGKAKTLTITSDKEGAQIEYTIIGGSDIAITKTEASPVSVVLDQDGDYMVEAFAIMDDYSNSDAAKLNFAIKKLGDEAYVLCKDASWLTEGAKVVFANGTADGQHKAMSKYQGGNFRGSADVAVEANTITVTDADVAVFTVGKSNGNLTFYTDNSYDYASSTVAGYLYVKNLNGGELNTQTSVDENAEWTVAVAADGAATIKAQGTATKNLMRYTSNEDDNILKVYADESAESTYPVYVYVLASTSAAGMPTFSVDGGKYYEEKEVVLTPGEGGTSVYYTINGGEELPYTEPIQLTEDGTYVISAYTAATETLAQSATVTNTYVINLPLSEPYILCKNSAWLTEGTKIIFANGTADGQHKAMSRYQGGNFRGSADVAVEANTITVADADVAVFTVGKSNGNLTFYTDNSYDYASSAVAGYLYVKNLNGGELNTQTSVDENAEWKVTVATDGTATIKAQGAASYNLMRFSSSYKAFNCYNDESKESPVYIYLLGSTSSVSSVAADGVKVTAAEGGIEVEASEAADVKVYTAAGQLVRSARVAEGKTLVSVAPGFYVVSANGAATKVVVR